LQVALQRVLVQFPDHLMDDHAVPVKKDRFRDACDSIANCRVTNAGVPETVFIDRQGIIAGTE